MPPPFAIPLTIIAIGSPFAAQRQLRANHRPNAFNERNKRSCQKTRGSFTRPSSPFVPLVVKSSYLRNL
jgi:hypothetical protein